MWRERELIVNTDRSEVVVSEARESECEADGRAGS